jgi:putative SOS response-associated peptidase YedK
MCSNYEGLINAVQFAEAFDVDMPLGGQASVWPAYESGFIRNTVSSKSIDINHTENKDNHNLNSIVKREALIGKFGMVPSWAGHSVKYSKLGLKTYNARSETVMEKPTYRDAWRKGQHCIIPAAAIYEPDWRSGKATPARIARADNQPMGIAGLWTSYLNMIGNEEVEVFSFTMLTINADTHPVFNNFHRPEDEKRMVVILQKNQFEDWLSAPANNSMAMMQPILASALVVSYPKSTGVVDKNSQNLTKNSNYLLFNA